MVSCSTDGLNDGARFSSNTNGEIELSPRQSPKGIMSSVARQIGPISHLLLTLPWNLKVAVILKNISRALGVGGRPESISACKARKYTLS